MLKLSKYEKDMLNGKYGKLKQQAIKKIVEYAKVLNAEELCEVSMAHLFCGAHDYLNASYKNDLHSIICQMQYCCEENLINEEEKMVCYCQSDCGPMDPIRYEEMEVEEEEGQKNKEYLDLYCNMGVNLVGTCVPYMCGFIPMKGEHYVSSESHAVTLMNSLWSACGNSDGLEAGFWAATCGRIPKWGNHIMENRKGTHLFNIKCNIETTMDWDLLGYTVGRKLPTHSIPVINELKERPNIFNIKYFFAAMATTAGPEMCHIVGITPEAPTLEMALGNREPVFIEDISTKDLIESYNILNKGKNTTKIDYISLGCPHYSIEELRYVSQLLKNKKICKDTTLNIWTASPIKEVSDRCGYTKIIEESGALVLTSSCPLTSNKVPNKAVNLAFDSAKQAHYIAPNEKYNVYYGSIEKCINSAIDGIWEV